MKNGNLLSIWELNQGLLGGAPITRNAKKKSIEFLLLYEEYTYMGFEAKLTSAEQIGVASTKYNLARLADKGGYSLGNCRFITMAENIAERDTSYHKYIDRTNQILSVTGNKFSAGTTHKQGENHHNASLTKKKVIQIWYECRNKMAKELNKYYGCSTWTIHAIRGRDKRGGWVSVTRDLPLTIEEYNDQQAYQCLNYF